MESKIQIITDQSQREIKSHGSYQYPVLVSEESLSRYKSGAFLGHWHKELEFTLVKSGAMYYQVNEETFYLKEGEALFGNSNTLHAGQMIIHRDSHQNIHSDNQQDSHQNLHSNSQLDIPQNNSLDCRYISITLDSRLLYGYEGSLLQTKYINTVIQNENLSAIHFNLTEEWHREVISSLQQINEIANHGSYFDELDIQLLLLRVFRLILEFSHPVIKEFNKRDELNLKRIKEILFFIQENYASRIELDDISRHINLCKSECCRLFKRYMRVSLFEYLLEYRIEKSLAYLINANSSVTEAALSVGFADPNYFSKVFHKLKGCSPSVFRLKYLSEG